MAALALKALAIWVGILALAMLNGALREFVLIPLLGRSAGLLISGLLLGTLIVATASLTVPWFGRHPASTFIAIGIGWLALTVVFEFSFGLARGKPLTEILAAYTFQDGNLWSLVLLVTAISPWLAAVLRHRLSN